MSVAIELVKLFTFTVFPMKFHNIEKQRNRRKLVEVNSKKLPPPISPPGNCIFSFNVLPDEKQKSLKIYISRLL